MTVPDPYDALPYRSFPIEWTAPERLALASLIHGGPRSTPRGYRVLELGCADGANLLPLAYHRRHAMFVGVDGARSQIEIARSAQSRLRLSNVDFIHATFSSADAFLEGEFDYIIAHGVFSWVSDRERDALLRLCAKRLRHGGLLYLNYNANPGWVVRGLVRDFLCAQTAGKGSLRERAVLAQAAAARVKSSLDVVDRPYSKLMASEFAFVCESDVSYVAHEYLADENHAYWVSEFLTLVGLHGFELVASADFNYSYAQTPEHLASCLEYEQLTGRATADTVDLLCYRQLHSPILTPRPFVRTPATVEEFGALVVASCLQPGGSNAEGNAIFQHPSGYTVEAKEEIVRSALQLLHRLWPHGKLVAALFPDVGKVMDDLKLLQSNGLIELRCSEPADEEPVGHDALSRFEEERDGYCTTRYHTRLPAVVSHFGG